MPCAALKGFTHLALKQFLAAERGTTVIVGVSPAEFLKCDGSGRAFGYRARPDYLGQAAGAETDTRAGGVVPTTPPPGHPCTPAIPTLPASLA